MKIVNGEEKSIFALVWSIILHFFLALATLDYDSTANASLSLSLTKDR